MDSNNSIFYDNLIHVVIFEILFRGEIVWPDSRRYKGSYLDD